MVKRKGEKRCSALVLDKSHSPPCALRVALEKPVEEAAVKVIV